MAAPLLMKIRFPTKNDKMFHRMKLFKKQKLT